MRHVWTVVCEKVVVDSRTNNASLDVLEQVLLGPEAFGSDAPVLVPMPMTIASLWHRNELDDPERGTARMTIIDPSGTRIAEAEIAVDLTQHVRSRSFAQTGGMPITGVGVYEFVIEQQANDDWTEVARVPLQVGKFEANGAKSS